MSNYNKLFSNTLLFAIGSFGSKLINFVLVPLYTFYLTTDEYGIIDLITVTIAMLIPIFSACIYDAVLRFSMDKKSSQKEIFSNGLFFSLMGILVMGIIIYPIFIYFNLFDSYLPLILVLLAFQVIQSLFSQFTRALGEVKTFAINGILTTFIIAILNVILIVNLNFGILGNLIASIIGIFISNTFLFISVKIYSYIDYKMINIGTLKKLLKYSVPLIPNSISLWVTNSISRYFILFFIGISGNGLFAVANKIPNLISMVYSIFYQSWQLTSIEEFEEEPEKSSFNIMFDYFSMLLLLGTSILLVIIKLLFRYFIAAEYFISWKYVPFLLLSTVFSSFSGLYGTNYIASKRTSGIFKTTMVGAIVNVLLNIILIPAIGTNGAGLSSMISYFVIWIIRIYESKKIMTINLASKRISLTLVIILLQILIMSFNVSPLIEFIILTLLFSLNLLINKKLFGFFVGIVNKINIKTSVNK